MARIVKGVEISSAICDGLTETIEDLKKIGMIPSLAIVRVGEDESQIAYERGAAKRCTSLGIAIKMITLPESASEAQVTDQIKLLNDDAGTHGVLLMRPLPKQINEEAVRSVLAPEKDVDGITDQSLAGVIAGKKDTFSPCTAKACIEVLDYLGIDLKGKHVAIVGSSLVVGKPVGMMLLNRLATVTLCHIHTKDVPGECRRADIIIAAAGCRGLINEHHVRKGQIIVDVGINLDENGKIHGDVDASSVTDVVDILTAVPGGVGAITTSVLAKHVVDAAKWQLEKSKKNL